MTNTITVIGRVGAAPEYRQTPWGDHEATFRLASSQRWRTKAGTWEEGETTWFTVRTLRHLALGVRETLEKGQQVVVTGRLRVRTWDSDRGKGFAVEIDAEHVGPDLMFASATVKPRVRAESASDARGHFNGASPSLGSGHVPSSAPPQGFSTDDASTPVETSPQWATVPVGSGAGTDAGEEPPF